MRSPRLYSALVGLALAVSLLGCGKPEPTASEPPPVAGGPGFPSSGNAVFDQHCAKCHALGEPAPAGPKGKKAPNLSKVGAEPGHTAEWLAEYVKNPKAEKPDSKMPAFESKLTPEEVRSVAEFLAAKR